jgi:hypothetical protein
MTINQLAYCMLKLRTNVGSNVPFLGDSRGAYESVREWMFKYSSFMGTFILSPPPPSQNVAPINMISTITSGSSKSFDPLVVPSPMEEESYGDKMSLTSVEVSSSMTSSAPSNMISLIFSFLQSISQRNV